MEQPIDIEIYYNSDKQQYIGMVDGVVITRQHSAEKCLLKLAKYIKSQG
jgi:hypothetical protein